MGSAADAAEVEPGTPDVAADPSPDITGPTRAEVHSHPAGSAVDRVAEPACPGFGTGRFSCTCDASFRRWHLCSPGS